MIKASALCCLIALAFSQADVAMIQDVAITLTLVEEERYVGEALSVRIVIKNRSQSHLKLKAQSSLAYGRGFQCELVGPKGPPLRSPIVFPQPKPQQANNFVNLAPGQAFEYVVPVMCWPVHTGDYKLTCTYRPFVDDDYTVKKVMGARFVNVPTERIVDTAVVEIPPHRGVPNPFRGRVELLNVMSKDSHELVYQMIDTRGEPNRYLTRRVLHLDSASRLVGVPMFFEKADFVQEVWVAYNKDQQGYIARIEFSTGKLLENLRMKDAFSQFRN